MRHDVLPEGREKEEVAECCRARLARDGGSVASAEASGGESTEARGEGASGESENRLRPAAFSWFRSLRNLSSRFLDLA